MTEDPEQVTEDLLDLDKWDLSGLWVVRDVVRSWGTRRVVGGRSYPVRQSIVHGRQASFHTGCGAGGYKDEIKISRQLAVHMGLRACKKCYTWHEKELNDG